MSANTQTQGFTIINLNAYLKVDIKSVSQQLNKLVNKSFVS